MIKKYLKHIIITAVFAFTYAPTFWWLGYRWFTGDSYYSHGPLVPFVSIFLIWQMKDELKKIEIKECNFGINLIVLGLAIHFFSSIFRVYFTSGFSMLITLIGCIIYLFGMELFKKISFPVLFIFFMIPMPQEIIANLSFNLKLFAAKIATILLNKIGILAINQGSIIKMRTAQVVVDDVCSGLRSLISLTALGSIFAYWLKSSMFKRILLFLCTIPIAVITNVCRVMILAFVSEVWGAKYVEGAVHDISGYSIFVIAFILLLACKKIIE